MAKNNSSTATKKSSFLKILWWALTPILITLIFFGVRSMITKKETGGVVKKVTSSLLKLAPAKPKEEVWDWTFEWEATAKQLASGRQKITGRINDAQVISLNANVLKFIYKRPSGKIVSLTLDRSDPKEFYFGRVAQSNLYLRVWLLPDEKGNFNGRFDNGPGKISMEVFLKKKL